MNRIVRALGLSGFGISLDWFTTHVGLSSGLAYETHPMASPINAALIFGGASLLLHKILPNGRWFNRALCLFNLLSFGGFLNNIIVILQAIW